MTSLVDDFAGLFAGNQEAIGTEEGGCARAPGDWWRQCILGHLDGSGDPIGVYPMVQFPSWQPNGTDPLPSAQVESLTSGGRYNSQWRVKWACVDFDEGDEPSWVHAVNLHNALKMLGIASWIERSRSKGYHVWVFFTEWCPAAWARRGLLWACQLVDAPTKEINPKQESLEPGQLGNYVRLPYPGGEEFPTKDCRRVVFRPNGEPVGLSFFVMGAMETRTDPEVMGRLAQNYVEPQRKPIKASWSHEASEDVAVLVERLSRYGRAMYEGGPLDEDRSAFMYKMAARVCEEGNFSEDECYVLLSEAPWNKYAGRSDEDKRLWDLIGKVYD